MKKIVVLPLDERPCNMLFPYYLFQDNHDSNTAGNYNIIMPQQLGDKKTPADFTEIQQFLTKSCAGADGLVLSIDMLLYGGLIPSRLHHLPEEELERRLHLLPQLRSDNPGLNIFAFHCIMRCPSYSSSDEEPDYYGICGKQLYELGICTHYLSDADARRDRQAGQNQPDGPEETRRRKYLRRHRQLLQQIDARYLADYTQRRAVNLTYNKKTLELVKQGVIDFMIIPQDDSAPMGFTAMDQQQVRRLVSDRALQHKVLIYPGADEVAMTLLTKMRNQLEGRQPAVYVQYAAHRAPELIPAYEDRSLGETIKYHLFASGCRPADSRECADLILGVTAPGEHMLESNMQGRPNRNYDTERSLAPFLADLAWSMEQGIAVAIADNAYANGGDLELLEMLAAQGLLMRLAGYSGWNTSSNTLGTAIAQGIQFLYDGPGQRHMDFLLLRYLEDCGYDSCVRQDVTLHELPGRNLSPFDLGAEEAYVSGLVLEKLQHFIRERLPGIAEKIQLNQVRLPWRRMFEADIRVRWRE